MLGRLQQLYFSVPTQSELKKPVVEIFSAMSSLIVRSLLALTSLTLTASRDLPFSWDTIPVWSFPGFSNDYFTPTDISNNNLDKFNQVLVCCINLKCINTTTNTTYPADIDHSHNRYYCSNENTDTVHNFYGNLEQSLQLQASQIKSPSSTFPNNTVVFGYIEWNNAQLSYQSQQDFCYDTTNKPQWLSIDAVGLINCMAGPTWCNYQGPSLYEYDFRIPEARQYFLNNVVLGMLQYQGMNYLDGVFLDSISLWMHTCVSGRWNCTELEINQLYNASLTMLDETLAALMKINKFASVSSHTYNCTINASCGNANILNCTSFYFDMMGIMKKYNGISIRYWEEYGMDDPQKFVSFLWEAQQGYKIEIHGGKTMNPDWVELASFLIAANNQSYFSHSSGWEIASGWWQIEYGYKLGAPRAGYEEPGSNCTILWENGGYKEYFCHREFENCIVDFDLMKKSATIKWLNGSGVVV